MEEGREGEKEDGREGGWERETEEKKQGINKVAIDTVSRNVCTMHGTCWVMTIIKLSLIDVLQNLVYNYKVK